jgi:hypothetical protein
LERPRDRPEYRLNDISGRYRLIDYVEQKEEGQ